MKRGLETTVKAQKVEAFDLGAYDFGLTRYEEEVVEELARAFSLAFLAAAPDLSPTEAQRLAVRFAQARAGELLRLDGDASIAAATRARVRELLARTIEEGESLRTLAKNIREDFAFSPQRATLIARTESATALGRGTLDAGTAQGREEKRWITQGDSLVSDACLMNEAAGWIPIGDLFPTGRDTVPQHPNCRCDVLTRHKPLAASADGGRLAEFRCPAGHLLGKDVSPGTRLWCRKCKVEVVAAEGQVVDAPRYVVRKTVERDGEGRIVAVLEEHVRG